MPWTPDNLLIVRETERAVIYEDGVYSETLEPGRHYVPKRYRFFTCTYYPVYDILMVDLREREVKLSDQKALTRDRQTISYSAWVAYQIDKNGLEILKHDKDQAALYTSVAKLEDRVKSDIELAAQRAIGLTNSERIIEERMAIIADFARELGERLATRGLLIASSDLRDFSIGDGTKSDKKGDDKPSVDFSGDWKAKLIANLPKSG